MLVRNVYEHVLESGEIEYVATLVDSCLWWKDTFTEMARRFLNATKIVSVLFLQRR